MTWGSVPKDGLFVDMGSPFTEKEREEQAENRGFLMMLQGEHQAVMSRLQESHLTPLMRRLRPYLAKALQRQAHYASPQDFQQEMQFFSRYIAVYALEDLFHRRFRKQTNIRGISEDLQGEVRSLSIFFLLAERYLAQRTERELRASQKQARISLAIALAQRWSLFAELPEEQQGACLPGDAKLEAIFLQMWLYRGRELLRDWLQDENKFPVYQSLDDASVQLSSTPQEEEGAVAMAQRIAYIEKFVPLVSQDDRDVAIWKGKCEGLSEQEIGEGFQQKDALKAESWTRARVAGRWNAMLKRLQKLLLLVLQYEEHPLLQDLVSEIEEAWKRILEMSSEHPDSSAQSALAMLPLVLRRLLVHLKNEQVLEICFGFWLALASLRALQAQFPALEWRFVVQYWLLTLELFENPEEEGGCAIVQLWSQGHALEMGIS